MLTTQDVSPAVFPSAPRHVSRGVTLFNALQQCRSIFENTDVQVPMVMMFLEVAKREETPVPYLMEVLAVSQTTISRMMIKLDQRGIGLMKSTQDPSAQGGRKVLTLTSKGRRAFSRLQEILAGQ